MLYSILIMCIVIICITIYFIPKSLKEMSPKMLILTILTVPFVAIITAWFSAQTYYQFHYHNDITLANYVDYHLFGTFAISCILIMFFIGKKLLKLRPSS